MFELLLGLLSAHELEVVDQENVDRTEFVLEGQSILALDGLDELIAEPLGGQIQHLGIALPLYFPGDGVLQVRFAEPDIGMQIERIEGPIVRQHGLGHLRGGGVRHAIGRTDDERIEGIAWVERGALETTGVRAPDEEGGARPGQRSTRLTRRRFGSC